MVAKRCWMYLEHVGKLGTVHFLAIPPHLLLSLRGLQEGDVGPESPELFAPFERLLQPQAGPGVCARHDEDVCAFVPGQGKTGSGEGAGLA